MLVAEAAVQPEETIHNMPFPVTAEMVRDAILAVDAIGNALLGS
jgi:glycerol dehydrogenase